LFVNDHPDHPWLGAIGHPIVEARGQFEG
jgi:hypothetical protein